MTNQRTVLELKAFYDDSPIGVFRADRNGAATYANDACREVTGRESEDLLGFGWIDTIHSDDRLRVLRGWREASGAGRPVDLSYRTVRPDGARRYVRVQARPLAAAKTPSGEYVAVVIDMTEQILAERRLRRNNELLSAVLENIPCGVTVYGADGSLVLDNQKLRRLLSLPEDDQEVVITDYGTLALEAGSGSGISYPDPRPSGSPARDFPAPRVREEIQPDGRVLEVRDAPMPTGGTVTTYTDITQHKSNIEILQQAQAAAEQAAAAKAAFLATMSHEIRTPMNGVIGMTNILLETRLTADQREIVEVIRQSGESLLVVLNDILDYSKIESGQMELEWLPLRLQEVVDQSLQLLASEAQGKQVALAVNVEPGLPSLILGDRNRLQQVLVNLISNAVKFTRKGQVRVSVRKDPAESRTEGGNVTGDLCRIRVCIQDTGIGIPREKIDSIFAPFVQADSSTARRYGGTGLGLAIAKRLVEAMGGSIAIKSEPGVGTEVCFDFLAETAVPRSRAANSPQASLWGKRVLLMRGSRSDVGVLVTQLKRWGLVIQTCHSSAQAVSMLQGVGGFDLIVAATHHLIDSRGLEFVKELREQGIAVPAVLLARKGPAIGDAELRAWIIARASTESELYATLVDAVHGCDDVDDEDQPGPVFDQSLGRTAPLRILVAEDNEINRRVVLRMLAGFGYTADVAHDGAQAIEAVKRRDYDLVFMDIQMPQVDGIEATRFIIENIPLARRPRIVAMSAKVMHEHVEAALAAGVDQYIGKPFAPSELREALEQSARRAASAATPMLLARPQGAAQLLAAERVRCHLVSDEKGEFLGGLTQAFASTGTLLLSRLAAAVQARNTAEVRAVVHEYSGMCAVIGAQKLTGLLLELQNIARAGSIRGAALLVQQCRSVQEETIAALQEAVQLHAARAARADTGAPDMPPHSR